VKELPVPCPQCAATATTAQPRRTALGYRTFRCRTCRRIFNERTATAFKHRQYPTDLVLLVVLWRLRDKLRLRDLAESSSRAASSSATRPCATGRRASPRCWPTSCGPSAAGTAGSRWHADETYLRVDGRWCSRYRAIDREGNLVEALLSERRDMAAAQRFFARALDLVGHAPEHVTTDGHDASPRAIRETLGDAVSHRTSRYKNNRIAQDHRGVKQRDYPLRGFGSFTSAARCCSGFEEQRQYFRAQARSGEPVSLAARRRRFQERWAEVMAEMTACPGSRGHPYRMLRPSACALAAGGPT